MSRLDSPAKTSPTASAEQAPGTDEEHHGLQQRPPSSGAYPRKTIAPGGDFDATWRSNPATKFGPFGWVPWPIAIHRQGVGGYPPGRGISPPVEHSTCRVPRRRPAFFSGGLAGACLPLYAANQRSTRTTQGRVVAPRATSFFQSKARLRRNPELRGERVQQREPST